MADFLTASALVRPWLNAGLRLLLTEDEARMNALRRSGGDTAAPRPSLPPQRPVPGGDSGPKQARPAPSVSRRVPPSRPATPSAAVSAAARPAAPAPDGKSILPPEQWPSAWVVLRKRRPLPPRPMVIWTYAGLGDDLLGTALPERQKLIVRLLTSLQHPAGTHVFWPFALPEAMDRGEGPASLFWSGETMLRPRVLLLFGARSAEALGLDPALEHYIQHQVEGRRVVLLPDPLLLAGEESLFARACPFLAHLLKFCQQGSSIE